MADQEQKAAAAQDEKKTVERKRSVTIELDEPLMIDGRPVRTFEMRRPKVKDNLRAEEHLEPNQGDAAREVILVALLCNISPEDFMELDMDQYKPFQNALLGFLA